MTTAPARAQGAPSTGRTAAAPARRRKGPGRAFYWMVLPALVLFLLLGAGILLEALPDPRVAFDALAFAPRAVAANSQLRRPTAKGRMAFSASALLMCCRPSSQ